MTKKIRLTIKCLTDDVPIAFKTLAVRIGEDFEETLRQLLELEQKNPLIKKTKGIVVRV